MKSTLVSQCKKSFNFKPLQAWPEHLPAYSWGAELLTGFESNPDKMSVDLLDEGHSLEKVLADIYPSLSLGEFARLDQLKVLTQTQFEYLLEKNSLRPSQSLMELLSKLSETPLTFQNWAAERKLGAKELYILKAVDRVQDIQPILLSLVELKASRQIGAQILENAIELFLMNLTISLPEPAENFEAWGQRLFKMRHPMQTEKIAARESNLSNLPWPKFLKVRVVEHQASLVNEVKLQFRSSNELLRNIEALKKVHTEIEAKA